MNRDACLNKFKESVDKLAERTAKEIGRKAQTNFNRFEYEASCDNPTVVVITSGSNGKYQVSCYGEQVIFIEFGVGAQNKSTYSVSEKVGWHGEHLDWVYKEKPSFGFSIKNNTLTETDPRPLGVVELGQYGKGLGKNDYWIRPTENGRVGKGESYVHIKDREGNDTGRVRRDVLWTQGHRPARALYRAIASVRRKSK